MLEKTMSGKNGSFTCSEDQESIALSCLSELFRKERYSTRTEKDYITGVKHFCFWLEMKRIPLAALNEEYIHEFLNTHMGSCTCPIHKGTCHNNRPALRHFLNVLRMNRIAMPAPLIIQPYDELLREFGQYLISVHGITSSSKALYLRVTKVFLKHIFTDTLTQYSSLTVSNIQEYVAQKASIYKANSAKIICTALRAFLRFLRVTNRLEVLLDEAVPTVAHWKLSTLPRYIDDDQLKTFLSSFNINTPLGLRNLAMALLMATVGLRSDEVAHLDLDDIDWRRGYITLTKTKSRRIDHVSLTVEAGKVLAKYLQKGRPTTDIRNVFVTHVAPVGRALNASAVRAAIRRVFIRCLPELPYHGTHVLRHTLATRMLHSGASLKEIADALRHTNIETSACYAKVDINGLSRVISPWPEVLS